MNDDKIYFDKGEPGGDRTVKATFSGKGLIGLKTVYVADDALIKDADGNEALSLGDLRELPGIIAVDESGDIDEQQIEVLAAMKKAERLVVGHQFAVYHKHRLFSLYSVDDAEAALEAARTEFLERAGVSDRNARRLANKFLRGLKVKQIS